MSWMRDRRWIGGAALLLLAAASLLLWRLMRQPVDPVWERIQRDGVWRVGMDPSFPPFESLNADGRPVGFDADLTQAIAARWGVEVAFQGIGFDGLIAALWADRADSVISALPVDPRLTRDVAYSIPYFDAGLLLVVKEGTAGIEGSDDLSGRRAAVEWGSEGDVQGRELRRRLQDMALMPLPDSRSALEAVLTGEADAALVEAIAFLEFRKERNSLRVVGDPLVSVPYVIAVQRDAPLLLQAINDALVDLDEQSTLRQLRERWLGE